MKRITSFYIILLFISNIIAQPLNIQISLKDGSVLYGKMDAINFPLNTVYAKLKIPLNDITSIQFADDIKNLEVAMENGDLLHG